MWTRSLASSRIENARSVFRCGRGKLISCFGASALQSRLRFVVVEAGSIRVPTRRFASGSNWRYSAAPPRSAWNVRAAVSRCSGRSVLRVPSRVKAIRPGTKVERRLLAAARSCGVVDGGVVVRREVVWPVSVVVAVDIGTWGPLSEANGKGRPRSRVVARSEKPLDGDGFRGQGQAIGHQGDHGAVCHRTRLIVGEKCRCQRGRCRNAAQPPAPKA
jgi:hypothetical protein